MYDANLDLDFIVLADCCILPLHGGGVSDLLGSDRCYSLIIKIKMSNIFNAAIAVSVNPQLIPDQPACQVFYFWVARNS